MSLFNIVSDGIKSTTNNTINRIINPPSWLELWFYGLNPDHGNFIKDPSNPYKYNYELGRVDYHYAKDKDGKLFYLRDPYNALGNNNITITSSILNNKTMNKIANVAGDMNKLPIPVEKYKSYIRWSTYVPTGVIIGLIIGIMLIVGTGVTSTSSVIIIVLLTMVAGGTSSALLLEKIRKSMESFYTYKFIDA